MSSLQAFIDALPEAAGPLTTETVGRCQRLVAQLARAPATEPWLAALHREPPEDTELYRDPGHGFVLLTHAEQEGRYRTPHDHGRGWVIYAVQHGEMEMGTYARIVEPDGTLRLVQRERYRMGPGDCRVFLPGDIHDTRCISSSVLMLRLTSCDLKLESRDGRLSRYVERAGRWTVA